MAGVLVTCENLVKIYKVPEAGIEVVALQGLDLEVREGELLAIVGRSGSGKTTLMNILGALDLPSAGRCVVDGNDLTRLAERERNAYRRFVVGHVWQQSGRNLAPDLTIAGNVSLPQLLAGVGRGARERRSRELLRLVGLAGMERRYPGQLSGGEQQRAALAVALANAPALLLADEPTGELDSATADEILALLRRLNRELGLTIIVVTHDRAVAGQADRTLAIRDGRTSTETVPRTLPSGRGNIDGASSDENGSAVIGLAQATHDERLVMDRAGRLQLPEEALARIAFAGRALLWLGADHVELWPMRAAPASMVGDANGSAVIGLPTETHAEAVVIDRVGRVQLSDDALERLPFGGYTAVRVLDDHVELWPPTRAGRQHQEGAWHHA